MMMAYKNLRFPIQTITLMFFLSAGFSSFGLGQPTASSSSRSSVPQMGDCHLFFYSTPKTNERVTLPILKRERVEVTD